MLFEDDFEDVTSPLNWIFSAYGSYSSSWEIGVPTSGPGAAYGGEKVLASNLSGDYASDHSAGAFTKEIDLSAATEAPKFDFHAYVNIPKGNILVRYYTKNGAEWEMTNNLELTVDSEGTGLTNGVFLTGYVDDNYHYFYVNMPESVVGEIIKIEFILMANGTDTYPGIYIDDVRIYNFK